MADPNRFSSSWWPPPLVKARGRMPKAMAQIDRTSMPLPVPAPDIAGALINRPGANKFVDEIATDQDDQIIRHMALLFGHVVLSSPDASTMQRRSLPAPCLDMFARVE
jgi:hypothetical protein